MLELHTTNKGNIKLNEEENVDSGKEEQVTHHVPDVYPPEETTIRQICNAKFDYDMAKNINYLQHRLQ